MKVQDWPLDRLKPYANNPRRNDAAVDRMIGLITEFSFLIPVLARSDGEVIDGHLRLKAAIKMGLPKVPVIVADDLTDAQVKAFRIAANKSVSWAEWDTDLLKAELADLQSIGFDLSFTGFDGLELRGLLGGVGAGKDPEEVPPAPAVPVSRLGDLWILGDHRLICGSCTDAATVSRVLDGIGPLLMVTDSPYGVAYDANWRNEADRANGKAYGARAVGRVTNDSQADWREAWALFPGDVAYCWHAGRHASVVQASLEAANFEIRSQIIWAKTRLIISRGDYHWQHEPCWYAVRKGKTGHWSGGRSQTTLWTIEHQKSETGHSTQKPIECMKRPIENNSKPGEWVYEPFAGSSTTVIAAEMTGRRCAAVEIEPAYVDVGVLRWQDFAGAEAVLQATGQTFAEVKAARSKKPRLPRKARPVAVVEAETVQPAEIL